MSKNNLLADAKQICLSAIETCLPAKGVKDTLKKLELKGNIYLVGVGKASFTMAEAAIELIDIKKGIIISKYNHISHPLKNVDCYEAGHPIIDENSIKATEEIIKMCSNLSVDDTVLFLLSGGASSLFEKPIIDLQELQDINKQMLNKGLSINEINTIRKKLSLVKGGRFADICLPAKVYSIILSDVLNDDLTTIGSGPTAKDDTSIEDVLNIIEKYDLKIKEETIEKLKNNSNGLAVNSNNIVIGSVRILCKQAMIKAKELEYEPILISDCIDVEAKEAGNLLFKEIQKYKGKGKYALIMGGETIVKVKGNGKGGRNQELVLSQVENIKDYDDVLIMSLGSDGTDGPTDAAGGYVDSNTYKKLLDKNIDYKQVLDNNDAYNALKAIDQLIITGPTGTNVNDICVALIN